jgi:hypothetical protein
MGRNHHQQSLYARGKVAGNGGLGMGLSFHSRLLRTFSAFIVRFSFSPLLFPKVVYFGSLGAVLKMDISQSMSISPQPGDLQGICY